ncbi:flagellar filament capping protein FliD [Aminipila butyrica]|uniref:Flagellar hook-associated protein 2 n=1 Tax=Aminipila butyrica TaxID=433296 RepID=A0A858BR83_9FIRM|nr:flagellar filament capping protein FliD [Aminipila butyrica]QIB68411.1 flagellar filament capping protein FliD [Aminipila butyrica]
MTSSVNSTSTSSTASTYSAKGYTGLASGIDTEAVVESMTADIQAKIDKVKQQQQTFTWKQDAYREVITSLLDFQSKYFSYASSTNLLSSNFYKCTSMVAGGTNASKISVTGLSNTNTPTYSVTGVSQLAKAASQVMEGSKTSADIRTGEISFDPRQVSLVSGGTISIKYGGSKYSVKIADDAEITDKQSFADALNVALKETGLSIGGTLGDKLQFSVAGERIELGCVDSKDTNSFSIAGGSSAVLNALHMKKDDKSTAGMIVGSEPTTESDLMKTVDFSLTGKNMTFNLNGLSKTITFTEADNATITGTESEKRVKLQTLIQDKLDKNFGKTEDGTSKIKVNSNADGSLSFATLKGTDGEGKGIPDETALLQINSSTTDTMGTKGLFNLVNGAKNRLDTSMTLKDLGFTADTDGEYKLSVNGKEFGFTGDTTVSNLISTINSDPEAGVNITYLSTSGTFSISADEAGFQGKVNLTQVGEGNLLEGLFGKVKAGSVTEGQDLKMTIRYEGTNEDVEVIRNSNAVSIDGINFTAQGEFTAATKDDYITFTPKADTDNIITAIKGMVEDYNKILDSVNSLVTTSSRSNNKGATVYKPLTDAQKKEMTSDEIKTWEEKAKKGILFQDSTLSQLASDLRFVFSTAITGIGGASSIGLIASSSYSDNGKITLDESKLKAALESDPEKVKSIFTATAESAKSSSGSSKLDGGLVTRMKTIMESYAKSTGAEKGSLVNLAGLANNATTNNNYVSRQQKILSQKLESLQTLLKTRQDRYQSQFTKLESYISSMNAQSSWLQSSVSS